MTKALLRKTAVYVAAVAALLLMLGVLTACSARLNGTYTRTTDEGNVAVYVFDKSNTVKFEVISPDGKVLASRTCTFKLSKGKIIFSDWSDGYEGRTLDIRIEKNSFYLGPDRVEFKKK